MNKQISSRLEDAITVFGRFLRQAGYSVGSGEIMQAVQAVNYIKIEKREDFRQALKTCLLSNYKRFVGENVIFTPIVRLLTQ